MNTNISIIDFLKTFAKDFTVRITGMNLKVLCDGFTGEYEDEGMGYYDDIFFNDSLEAFFEHYNAWYVEGKRSNPFLEDLSQGEMLDFVMVDYKNSIITISFFDTNPDRANTQEDYHEDDCSADVDPGVDLVYMHKKHDRIVASVEDYVLGSHFDYEYETVADLRKEMQEMVEISNDLDACPINNKFPIRINAFLDGRLNEGFYGLNYIIYGNPDKPLKADVYYENKTGEKIVFWKLVPDEKNDYKSYVAKENPKVFSLLKDYIHMSDIKLILK